MPEIIALEDLTIDFESTLERALDENGFLPFRVDPRFREEKRFPPKFKGKQPGLAHFFSPPPGSTIDDLPKILSDRILREPKDIREVIAVGDTLEIDEIQNFVIYAPEYTGAPQKLLHILRYDGWDGFGLLVHTFDPDDDVLSDMKFIAFSDP